MHLCPHEIAFFTRMNANAVSYMRMCMFAYVPLYGFNLNAKVFAHKLFQHSNALWVQKRSRCTIV